MATKRGGRREDFPPHVFEAADRYFDEARAMEASGQVPRKHHLVPRFYLEAWARDGHLRATRLDAGESFTTSPEKAARETDYYRIASQDIDENEIPPNLIEHLLGKVEGEAAKVITRLRVEPAPNLSQNERFALAVFIGVQFTRGRRERELRAAMANETFKLRYGGLTDAGIAEALSRGGREASDTAIAESREFIDGLVSGEIVVAPKQAASIGLALRTGIEIGAEVSAREWVVASAPPVVITCDEPVVCIDGPGSPRGEHAGLTAALVAFPLAPDRILLITSEGVRVENHLSHADVADLNLEILASSHSLAFELPGRSFTTKTKVPPLPAPVAMERRVEQRMKFDDDGEGEVIRFYRPHRFAAEPWRPWPVPRWWRVSE